MKYEVVREKFWNGKETVNGKTVTYKFDEDGFRHAILRAFNDLTQRTMTRIDSTKPVAVKTLRDYVCDKQNYDKKGKKSFLELLNEYFDPKKEFEYNKWHKSACESILTCLKCYYVEKSVSYGKAQKIVNMTMKGIYCLEGADKHVDKFKPCHMALDYFTLEWFYRCCNNDKYKKESFAKEIGRKNLSVWSNMKKVTEKLIDKDSKQQKPYTLWGYYVIQSKITGLVKKFESEIQTKDANFEVTPFEAEFFIWPQMQITLAAEALYSNLADKEKHESFKSKDIEEKYNMLKDLLEKTESNAPNFI